MTNLNGLNILQLGNTPKAQAVFNTLKLPAEHLLRSSLVGAFRAQSLTEANEFLNLKRFEIVLLSLDFSQEDCFAYLAEVHQTAPSSSIVIIADSQYESQAAGCVKHGASDYLTLDELTPKNLARVMRYAIERTQITLQTLETTHLDSTTGLTNRFGFMNYIQRQLAEAERLQFHLSLFYVDCDNFKMINDTLGHQKGDDFLAHFASNLRQCVRNNDFVARLSADEFVLVINSKDNRVIPSAVVADKILQSIRRGIQLSTGEHIEAHCSIGITHYNGEGRAPSPDKFLQEANSALKQSKKKGGDCTSFFDRDLGRKAERRIQLLKSIRIAFKRGEFFLHYQPIIEATTDRVRGYEALLRWNRSGVEMVSPTEFVPLLEETGMIHIIGSWVIQQACLDFGKLKSFGCVDKRSWISVNISPMQLQDPNFVRRLKRTLAEGGIASHHLHLEITESSLMEKSEFTFQTLAGIKELGCALSLDDFGVGYSSMNHLKELPIDTLKIDQSFVRHFDDEESDRAIIRAMVSLAHNLDKAVVAEGVETADAANFLKQRRCEYLQGFLYSKPLTIDDAIAYTIRTNRLQSPAIAKSSASPNCGG
ncbi:putative bifunctional diguanylate cyclase/phosphodiesterase [Halioxenophilus sp. WMMB6]|uniref:putative bifunctional diguanylate cyclase/phosphodiesterase n=1 Tax=Halioxenophilus sp. WMMB6 TaxID=3073815 RepID=UPI00295EC658|nr:EAL domain-containing protein [Halioxenophilus sp. WMMB6]